VLTIGALVRAQKPSSGPAPDPTAQAAPVDSRSQTVRVEAIVTDKQGRLMLNLRPSDFELRENGVVQAIDSAVLTSRPPAAAPPGAKAAEAAIVQTPIATVEEEERAAREPGARVIGLYLDEFHISSGPSSDRVRESVLRFLDDQVRPMDLLIVMKPLDSVTNVRFSRDRAEARKAIETFKGRKDDYTPRTAFEEEYMGRSPEAVRAARAQIVLSGLRAVASRIGDLNAGMGGLVLLTEGFEADVPRSGDRRLPDLQGLVRAASRFRVALYAMNPNEGAAQSVGPDAPESDAFGPSSARCRDSLD